MQRTDLFFERPTALQATMPPEARHLQRDEVRLLVTTPAGHRHTTFAQLADFLEPGDLVVVNRSATLPASLPVSGPRGDFLLNLSTHYGDGLWLAEPRWSPSEPGPLPLAPGDPLTAGNADLHLIAPYPGLARLWFVRTNADLCATMQTSGSPIRYGYVTIPYPLAAYQTIFAKVPGSAEMPSAGRPFSQRVVRSLRERGVKIAGITLHTGVSSLEIETEKVEAQTMYAEPFHVPVATARLVNATRQAGHRVIAVGTTVVRALESAWDGEKVCPARGFTRLFIHPQRGVHVVDGLVTGFHDPLASHLAMLYAIAGQTMIQDSYHEAVQQGYLWHEFGDSHLILRG
jgi:S-adenosylmethionine:tRNA ribosyltransferase-isomerase